MTDDVQFNLRIPATLKDKVKEAAKESGRSINAEAQFRLEQSFTNSSLNNPQDTLSQIDRVLKIIKDQENVIDSQQKTIKNLDAMLENLMETTRQTLDLIKKKNH